MKQKEFDILLDIRKPNKTDIEVVQDDINTNVFNISIIDGLEPFDLSGCDIDIVFLKSDKTTVVQSSTSDPPGVGIVNEAQGKIQCILYTNTIACPGPVIAEVKINEAGALLTTGRFEFFVRESLINEKTLESTNEFPILKQLAEEVSGIVENMPVIEGKLNEIEDANSELNQTIQTGQTLKTELEGSITDAYTAKAALDNSITTGNDLKDELHEIIAGTDFEEVLQMLDDKLDKDGDSKDNVVTFNEAAEDEDIQSGEKHSTLFGKILKSIKTLRAALNNKLNKTDLVNTDQVNDPDKVPSSAVTHGLREEINDIDEDLSALASAIGALRLVKKGENGATAQTVTFTAVNSTLYLFAAARASMGHGCMYLIRAAGGKASFTPIKENTDVCTLSDSGLTISINLKQSYMVYSIIRLADL